MMKEKATPPHVEGVSVRATAPTPYLRTFVLSKTTVLKNPDWDCDGVRDRVTVVVGVPERVCVSDAVGDCERVRETLAEEVALGEAVGDGVWVRLGDAVAVAVSEGVDVGEAVRCCEDEDEDEGVAVPVAEVEGDELDEAVWEVVWVVVAATLLVPLDDALPVDDGVEDKLGVPVEEIVALGLTVCEGDSVCEIVPETEGDPL